MSNLAEDQIKLSDFFSILSKEKDKNRKELRDKIKNPTSDLSNLFSQLEGALLETKEGSEEPSDEKILSPDDQKSLNAFSNLMNSFNSMKEVSEEIEIKIEEEVLEEPVEQIEWEESVELSSKEVVKNLFTKFEMKL